MFRREFSARDLLGSALAAIERLDPELNAIVQKDAASPWRAASDSDARIAGGEARLLEGFIGKRLLAFGPALAGAPQLAEWGATHAVLRHLPGVASSFSQEYSTFWPSFFSRSARLP